MLEIRKTEAYARWIDNLRDLQARARVQVRIERLAVGNPGGDKTTQSADIKVALRLARNL